MGRRPTVPEVVGRFAEYLSSNPSWGALHLVLEDQNVTDSNVSFCKDRAIETGDREGLELAEILMRMSRTQRLKLGDAARAGARPKKDNGRE